LLFSITFIVLLNIIIIIIILCHMSDVNLWTPSLRHVIPAGRHVGGVTSLGDQLFVVRRGTSPVEVYDTATFTLQRTFTVDNISSLFGVASCAINNCLYIADHNGSQIHKIELSHNDKMTHWSVATHPVGVSVNKTNNVLVACYGVHKIQEYTTQGTLIRNVSLSPNITHVIHVTQLTCGQFVVTYGQWASSFKVSIVGNDGVIVRSYCDETNSSIKSLTGSSTVAVDSNDNILVCDWSTKRVIILNSSLTTSRDLPLPSVNGGLNQPWSLYVDESRDRLYVGEWSGQRVLVCSIVK